MIPPWWGEFNSMSIFGSGSRFGLIVALATFRGFGGNLTLGRMTIGGIRALEASQCLLGAVELFC